MFQHLEYMTVQNLDKRAFGSVNAVGVIPGPIGAWRKKDIIELGGFSTDTLVEDQDLTLALLAKGKKVVYAERAVAYTEAPYRLGDLFKQRVRWIRGTIQCLWKYKFYLLNPRRPQLGFLILPNVLIYTIVLSVFYPVINGLFVVSLLTPVWREMWNFFLLFLLVDYSYTVIAFISERRYRKLLLMLPMQRLFYHLVMNVIVIKSVLNAIEGSTALWSRVFKRGEAAKYHFEAINYQSAMTVAVPNRHRW